MTATLKTEEARTLLLSEKQVMQRINRLAYQIYEDNAREKEIVLAGIVRRGYLLAELIAEALKRISPLKITLTELIIDKHGQANGAISVAAGLEKLQGKAVILIDDVIDSGKTMMYSLKPLLEADIKKIRTVVLIDRNHKRFPLAADFTGLSLATTLQEHVDVEFNGNKVTAWLS
jgi:pyrimidine operon attenuation protein/uracil phosphoribosyltransferase